MAGSVIENEPDCEMVIADKGYDSQTFWEYVSEVKQAKVVLPRRKNKTKKNSDMDWAIYKHRHLVENAFARIKQFRAISMRYDKLERNYSAMLSLSFVIVWFPMHY